MLGMYLRYSPASSRPTEISGFSLSLYGWVRQCNRDRQERGSVPNSRPLLGPLCLYRLVSSRIFESQRGGAGNSGRSVDIFAKTNAAASDWHGSVIKMSQYLTWIVGPSGVFRQMCPISNTENNATKKIEQELRLRESRNDEGQFRATAGIRLRLEADIPQLNRRALENKYLCVVMKFTVTLIRTWRYTWLTGMTSVERQLQSWSCCLYDNQQVEHLCNSRVFCFAV